MTNGFVRSADCRHLRSRSPSFRPIVVTPTSGTLAPRPVARALNLLRQPTKSQTPTPRPNPPLDGRIEAGECGLATIGPVWIGRGHCAGVVQMGHLLRAEFPTHRAQILAELLLIARTEDHCGDAGPLQQPVDSDLRNRSAGFLRHLIECINHPKEVLVRNWRPETGGHVKMADLRQWLATAKLAGQSAPTQGAPDDRAHSLIEAQRHQLPLIVSTDQRVVDLVRNVAGVSVSLCDRERLHYLPARKIGDPDITDFARAHEVIERDQYNLDRGRSVEGVQLKQIDVIGSQPPQRRLASANQTRARVSSVVRPIARRQACLGGDEDAVALTPDCLAKQLFRGAVRVHVRGIKHRDAYVQADVDQSPRFDRIGVTPGTEQPPFPAKSARAKAEDRNFQSRCPQISVLRSRCLLVPWMNWAVFGCRALGTTLVSWTNDERGDDQSAGPNQPSGLAARLPTYGERNFLKPDHWLRIKAGIPTNGGAHVEISGSARHPGRVCSRRAAGLNHCRPFLQRIAGGRRFKFPAFLQLFPARG